MNKPLTLGSLFSGSGTFEMAGMLSGIVPVWKSEIEPFPIAVTEKRLPFVKHLGDINKINGAEIEPVDIITFGSPCTDLSVAGKRQGLNAARSGLFFQAVRIIKEMRYATNGKYPGFAVWENVTGALSSNKGEDFRCVLEELCKIKTTDISVPKPEKWTKAGEILADGFSLAYRTVDAQYWGVPQRRMRIYLVADFNGERASKILFESESLSGYSPQSFCSWKETARSFGTCSEETSTSLMFENHSQDTRYTGPLDVAQTISASYGTGGNNQPFVVEHFHKAYGICGKYSNSMLSDNPNSGFYEADTARTIDTSNQSPCKNSHHTVAEKEKANTLVASDYKDPPVVNDSTPETEYIVRRLTPQECALLQGMPTWWCDNIGIENPTEEQIHWWQNIFEIYNKAVGKTCKPKSRKQLEKWLKDPYSDSAAYKMWGNGIYLGNAWFVLSGIAYYAQNTA